MKNNIINGLPNEVRVQLPDYVQTAIDVVCKSFSVKYGCYLQRLMKCPHSSLMVLVYLVKMSFTLQYYQSFLIGVDKMSSH